MDFARKILNKYGWKEGDGLGKNNDGISKPLKARLKFDGAGLGADQAASDFNNHWWERVFNEAAKNVDVKTGKNGVSMDLKNHHESVEITTKGYSVQKLKKAKQARNDEKYDNFLQSALLTKSGDEVENPERTTVEDIEVKKFKQLTDEELFKACGGRTAHKGARHGLKLSGKLARLEMQEKELLANMLAKSKQKKDNDKIEDVDTTSKKKKKDMKNDIDDIPSKKIKKRKIKSEDENEDTAIVEENKAQIVSKKKKKKISETGCNLNTDLDVSEQIPIKKHSSAKSDDGTINERTPKKSKDKHKKKQKTGKP